MSNKPFTIIAPPIYEGGQPTKRIDTTVNLTLVFPQTELVLDVHDATAPFLFRLRNPLNKTVSSWCWANGKISLEDCNGQRWYYTQRDNRNQIGLLTGAQMLKALFSTYIARYEENK